jgi:hypothetical protein
LARELEREVNVGWTDIIPEPEADGSLLALMLYRSGFILIFYTRVADLGPPGSGSISQRSVSGSFHHQTKIVRKILGPVLFCDFFYFLSLKNYVNVPSKSNKQKNLEKDNFV